MGPGARIRAMRTALAALALLLTLAGSLHGQASTEIHPLEPPDMSSPRATLETFLGSVNRAWELYEKNDPNFRKQFAVAKRSLDVSDVAPNLVDSVQQEGALILKEILDRIEIPPAELIPGTDEVLAQGLDHWTLPHTEIEIHRVESGEREGEFLFSPETVARTSEFYERVRDLPYKPGKTGAHYDELRFSVESRFLAGIVAELPDWTKEEYNGQLGWQWLVIALLVLLSLVLIALSILVGRRLSGATNSTLASCGSLLPPIMLISLQWIIPPLAPWPTALGGAGVRAIGLGFQAAAFVGVAWLAAILIISSARLVIHVSGARERPLHQQLIEVCAKVLALLAIAGVMFYGGQELGIPMSALVTGLGVGGLAVALAAQSTLENLVGGMNLFADRPVKIGELCRFGNELGVVEGIGLRSTRIRTLGRSVVSIPNSSFARMEIENFSRRDRIQMRTTLRLEYGTGPDEVEAVLEGLREMFASDERIAEEPRRVRLIDLGGDAIHIEINVYILTTDWNLSLAIREELFLEAMRIVDSAGLRLVPPTARHEVVQAVEPRS